MTVRIRRPLSPTAHWPALLIGAAVLLDVVWLASRFEPARASAALSPTQQIAAGADRSGPPSLHMHTVF